MFNRIFNLDPHPSPDLAPFTVVKIQLEALQNNDIVPDNQGIRLAFRFTSPSNQAVVGPIDRFIELVKNPLYSPLIGFEEANLDTFELAGDTARQRVRLRYRKEWIVSYIFALSRQQGSEYEDCWMTDTVLRVN